jgi:hypothetical protein
MTTLSPADNPNQQHEINHEKTPAERYLSPAYFDRVYFDGGTSGKNKITSRTS